MGRWVVFGRVRMPDVGFLSSLATFSHHLFPLKYTDIPCCR
jgi:hypothetical protein